MYGNRWVWRIGIWDAECVWVQGPEAHTVMYKMRGFNPDFDRR